MRKRNSHCSGFGFAVFAVSLGLLVQPAGAALSIDWVTVGNAANPGDPGNPNGAYGSVDYDYQIGAKEVTLSQYSEFLNAVAGSDLYGLYNPSMGSDLNIAGISRSGIGTMGDPYSYSAFGGSDRPVTYVSWFDAARFANWMHNGQGSGSTETGAYELNGATSGISFTKAAGANVWIPSENEWYKAAYYDPTSGAGGGDNYWLYPTQSDGPPGNETGANYFAGDYTTTPGDGSYSSSQNYLTGVGAFIASASHYGTFDQGGNVREWTDAIDGSSRVWRGGSWADVAAELRATDRSTAVPTIETREIGFRVASVVPEPSVGILGGLAGLLFMARRRRAAA